MVIKTKVGKEAWAYLGDVEEVKEENCEDLPEGYKSYEREDLYIEEQNHPAGDRTGKLYRVVYASGKVKHCLFWETTYLLNESGKTIEKLN